MKDELTLVDDPDPLIVAKVERIAGAVLELVKDLDRETALDVLEVAAERMKLIADQEVR